MMNRRNFLQGATGTAVAGLLAAQQSFARELQQSDSIRNAYTLDTQLSYLNHASVGTIPKPVQAAHRQYLSVCESFPSLYVWGDIWDKAREQVRAQLAEFLSCEPKELAITRNTTEGFNLLAQGLQLSQGAEVVFSQLNHVGASKCFEFMADAYGYQVKRFELPLDELKTASVEQVVELHTKHLSPKTELLVLPHIDNLIGLRHPVDEIARAAKRKGVRFVAVDGAQTVGMIPLNLNESTVDFYSGSGHKWLQAPKGLGLLYINESLIEQLRPISVTWGHRRWKGTARVFEDYGTRDLPELLALGDAVTFHQKISWDDRLKHYQFLRDYTAEQAKQFGFVWSSPQQWDMNGSLYSVLVNGVDGKKLEHDLIERKLAVRVFASSDATRVRLSPNLMNKKTEVDRLFMAIRSLS